VPRVRGHRARGSGCRHRPKACAHSEGPYGGRPNFPRECTNPVAMGDTEFGCYWSPWFLCPNLSAHRYRSQPIEPRHSRSRDNLQESDLHLIAQQIRAEHLLGQITKRLSPQAEVVGPCPRLSIHRPVVWSLWGHFWGHLVW